MSFLAGDMPDARGRVLWFQDDQVPETECYQWQLPVNEPLNVDYNPNLRAIRKTILTYGDPDL
jgi:hypothetical protein